jgi:hypothetical protein
MALWPVDRGCQAWKTRSAKQGISNATQAYSLELTVIVGEVNVDLRWEFFLSAWTCKSPQRNRLRSSDHNIGRAKIVDLGTGSDGKPVVGWPLPWFSQSS